MIIKKLYIAVFTHAFCFKNHQKCTFHIFYKSYHLLGSKSISFKIFYRLLTQLIYTPMADMYVGLSLSICISYPLFVGMLPFYPSGLDKGVFSYCSIDLASIDAVLSDSHIDVVK